MQNRHPTPFRNRLFYVSVYHFEKYFEENSNTRRGTTNAFQEQRIEIKDKTNANKERPFFLCFLFLETNINKMHVNII